MDKDMFKERERSFEEDYFREHEAKLIEKLRERARLEEIAEELAVTLDTASAFLLAPLVQVAWAGGGVTDRERQVVLRVATARGVEKESPGYAQLGAWLRDRPVDEVFDAAVEAIKTGLSVLTPAEQAERTRRIVDACRQVAEASGGLGKLLRVGSGVSGEEESLLNAISTSLRAR